MISWFLTCSELHTPNVAKSVESIAEAVIHCRFEATDPDSDEVVLIKILQVRSPIIPLSFRFCYRAYTAVLVSYFETILFWK